MRQQSTSSWLSIFHMVAAIILLILIPQARIEAQQLTKIRISNASLVYTSVPLLVAKDWGIFAANGLDAEIIVMNSSLANPALAAGSIDYVAGIGPSSLSATLSGLPSRAMWFSSDKTIYWLMARPQYKSLESLRSKKLGISGVGGSNQVALLLMLEKLGANPKDYAMVSLPGQELSRSLETGYIDAANLAPPAMFSAQKKGFNKVLDMTGIEMPTGGLTTLLRTIQTRPTEVKRVIRSLQLAKEEIRKSKDKTVDFIVRFLKIDREVASETYDLFLNTLNPTGIPTQAGIEAVVKALHTLGRFTDRKISFAEIADDRLATEVAREMGYKIP